MHKGRFSTFLLFFLLPLIVFAFTSIGGLNEATPFLALGFIIILVVLRFLPNVKISRRSRSMLWVLLVLSLVGSTGWFTSPFFFALYLMAIGLSFILSPVASIAFTVSLVIMFSFSISDVNPSYDFLTLLALLSVIPITYGLRRIFLLVEQEGKDILILETGDRKGMTSLDSIIANRVNNISILVRQPMTYIKQGLWLLAGGKLSQDETQDVVVRMRNATDEVTTLMKEFESETTKNLLVNRKRP